MMSSCTFERWTTIAALFVVISQVLLLSRPAGAAPTAEALLAPTPLVLKDGRIANVSIHVLPFVAGKAELAGDTAGQLAELTASVATDCFLTAQVIGHVSSGEVAASETLAAHRLARSRADAVQASLIGGGLPAKAIASVWDWQFLVREPRATLWVFRLIRGEDCDGVPLDGGAELVAGVDEKPPAVAKVAGTAEASGASDKPATRAAETPKTVASVAEAPRAARGAESPKASPVPADRTPVDPPSETKQSTAAPATSLPPIVRSAVAAEAPAQAPAQAEPPEQPAGQAKAPRQASLSADSAADGVPVITRPLPALSPAQDRGDRPSSLASPLPAADQPATNQPAAEPPTERTVAAVQPARPTPPVARTPGGSTGDPQQSARQSEQDPERQGKVESGKDGDVIITFATNSSYFPPGASRQLRSMIDEMTGKSYRVQLQVGVSGSDQVVGAASPEEARRYNKWLAERRASRVQEWLSENAQDKQLAIEPEFLADDSSRRVVVRIVPTG